ncbi:MAG: hypothetical protein U0165_14920 [Polyangiaceae bacterium]
MALDRVALHQTRLRTPGLGLDAQGIALGSHGLVLFPSLDRLVAFFAVYAQDRPLDDLMAELRIELVKSPLGAREAVVVFQAESSGRMDHVAEAARLTHGHTFTGSGRHWVQYRDASAPFGYDAVDIPTSEARYLLYHQAYSQAFDVDKTIDLRSLLLRLSPHVDPSAGRDQGPKWLLCEGSLGHLVVTYLRRSSVKAKVAIVEWPPLSALDDEPVRKHLIEIPALPERMLPLFTDMPGVTLFYIAAPGAGVQVGFRHPVHLPSIPQMRGPSIVLFKAKGQPIEIDSPPLFASLEALTRFALADAASEPRATKQAEPTMARVPLRLVPSLAPWREITATWISSEQLPLFRRLLYALGPNTLSTASMVLTEQGAFVRAPGGIDSIPLGSFFRSIGPRLYIPAGFSLSPEVDADVATEVLDLPSGSVTLLRADATAVTFEEGDFLRLDRAVVAGHRWAPLATTPLAVDLDEPLSPPKLLVEPLGINPLGDVKSDDRTEPRTE